MRALALAVALVATVGLSACSSDDPTDDAAGDPTGGPTSPSASVDPADATTGPGPTATTGVPPSAPEATPPDDDATIGTEGPSSQEDVLETLPGDASGACVDADRQNDVRSGGMGAGSFKEAAEDFADPSDGDNLVSLHWVPAHGEDLTGLRIEGTQVSGGSETFVTEQTSVSELVDESGTWRYYYNTEIEIPAPGLWRLEASSGDDTGCFMVTFVD